MPAPDYHIEYRWSTAPLAVDPPPPEPRGRERDIVLSYTTGTHHRSGPEDWPVMSTVWHQIALLPPGFFNRNPAFDEPTGGPAK